MTDLIDQVSTRMRSSQVLRLLTVGVLVLLLQIPIAMIGGQVSEREMRGIEAIEEVSSKWGNEQIVSGPVLVVPYIGRYAEIGRNVVIAWKPGRESARAVFEFDLRLEARRRRMAS